MGSRHTEGPTDLLVFVTTSNSFSLSERQT